MARQCVEKVTWRRFSSVVVKNRWRAGKARRRLEMDMGEWRPIETAPKDRTRILAYQGKVPDDETPQIMIWIGDRWVIAWDHSDLLEVGGPNGYEPTHWMPLPDPPTDT